MTSTATTRQPDVTDLVTAATQLPLERKVELLTGATTWSLAGLPEIGLRPIVLSDGPIEVGRLAFRIGASQPNVSQHLAVLRNAGLVDAERDGREVRYRLSDPDVMVACGLMRSVLERRLARLGRMAS